MTTYEEVKNITTEEYFEGNQFSIDAFNKKYRISKSETYVQAIKRVCDYIASCEKTKELQTYWSNRWFDEIYNDWWHPSGSIMQGANSGKNISLANCTTTSLGTGTDNEEWDSLEGIIRNAAYTVSKMAAYRQGLGLDFSKLRPANMTVKNSSNETISAIHWMKLIDSLGNYIGQKGRIPAMLFSLSCSHPDIEEFIKVKSDYSNIQNANISVQCTEEFYNAVEKDLDWELRFDIPEKNLGDKIYVDSSSIDGLGYEYDTNKKKWYYICKKYRPAESTVKTVKAKELMKLIAKNMFLHAEPGIQNIDTARYYSNSDYVYDENDIYDSRIISSNAPITGDTLIPTKYGIFTADKIIHNDKNIFMCDTIATAPKKYLNWKNNTANLTIPRTTLPIEGTFKSYYNQQVWELEFDNYQTIKCSGQHKWLTENGFIKTEELTNKDRIVANKDGIISACEYTTDKNSKEYIDGLLIGYFVGDGFFVKPSKQHKKIAGIVYSKDDNLYSDLFRQKYKELTGKDLSYTRDRGKIFETRTENNLFISWLESFGFKEDKYFVPQIAYENINFSAGFLRGIFQADGSIGKRRIHLTTVSKTLVIKIQQLLNNWFGIFTTVTKSESKGVKYCLKDGVEKISNFKPRYDIIISHHDCHIKFLNFIGLDNIKEDKLIKLTNIIVSRNTEERYRKIISIKKTDNYETMYCANIPNIHSFIVDGLISSNCSEQYLSNSSLCILGSINLGRFSATLDMLDNELSIISPSINRFLDNVNEMELINHTYATPLQKLAIEKLRRTGAGFTNISAWLFKNNVGYGTTMGNEMMEEVMKKYNYYLYKSSIELGKEKGSFGLFNREKYEKSPFIQKMIKLGLEFEEMRNVTCSSIAPTGCVNEDTRIKTSEGLIKIKDLVEEFPKEKQFLDISDRNIYAYDEFGKSKITKFYNNGIIYGYKITLSDGRELKISETHRIRVFNSGKYSWKYAPELEENDIIVSYIDDIYDDGKYQPLIISNKISGHFNATDIIYPEKFDETLAEFIGLFTGDGSLKFRSNNEKLDAIRFPVFGEDVDLLYKIENMYKSLFNVDAKYNKHKTKNMYEICGHSINMCQFFVDNNLLKKYTKTNIGDAKKHIFTIPEIVFRSPKSVRRSYLRGLFEADGSISKNRISFSTKHKQLASDVQEILFSLGIQSNMRLVNNKNAYSSIKYIVDIVYQRSYDLFKNTIGFLSDRKNNILNTNIYLLDKEKIYIGKNTIKNIKHNYTKNIKLYNRLNAKMNGDYINRTTYNEVYKNIDLPFNKDNFSTQKIKKIEREKFQTYDIEVEKPNHTYISANGIINHNTLSLMFRGTTLSYGIEPPFDLGYWKRTRMNGKYEYYFCIPSVVKDIFLENGINLCEGTTIKDTWDGKHGKKILDVINNNRHLISNFKKATDITPLQKMDLMAGVSKWCDSSISVTYLLPEKTTVDEIYEFIMEAHRVGLKSIAAFPDKQMYGIISFVPFKDLAISLVNRGFQINSTNLSPEELSILNKSTKVITETNENIVKTIAPTRPKSLNCDVHHIKFTKKSDNKSYDYCVFVGLIGGDPYEVFVMNNGTLSKKYTTGILTKEKTGVYSVTFSDGTYLEDITKKSTESEDIFTRMTSTCLRHGADIKYIVEQLEKSEGDMWSFGKAMARALKKYIPNGTKIKGDCPICGGSLIRNDGCKTCSVCEWTACN